MDSTVGIWSPNDLILPTVDADLDYKFFFVTEEGSIDGLDITFNPGDWLVYIKKDGKPTWHKSSGGIVNYSGASSANAPEPGYYSKIRVDNSGNIIDAGYITLEDLPKHTHDIKDVTGDIENKIKDTVGQMFQHHRDSSVKFQYDPSTKCITAEVNYDDATITRNEFGELVAQGGGGSGGGSLDPDAYTCGNHRHGVSQIDGFEDAVKKIIDKNVVIDVHNIPIDGETIKLNGAGQLTAVASGNRPHEHKMKDITDLNQDIANVWASNQLLQRDQNYSDGLLNVTNQTIGYAIRVINEYLVDITDRVENIGTKIDTIETPEPLGIDFASIGFKYNQRLDLIDKDTLGQVEAGSSVEVSTDFFYPINKGKITVVIDDEEKESLILSGFEPTSNGNLEIAKVQDSYFGNPMYMGKYKSGNIKYITSSLEEGYHTLYFTHTIGETVLKTETIKFQTYVETQPSIENRVLTKPEYNNYVSGVPCYTGDGLVQIEPTISYAFSKQFMKLPIFRYSVDGEEVTPPILSIDSNNKVHLGIINAYAKKENNGIVTINEVAFNIRGKKVEKSYSTNTINWNDTDIEQYRVTLDKVYDNQIPEKLGIKDILDYDSKDAILNHEMIIIDNIGKRPSINYSNISGPDYSKYNLDSNGFVWVNLKFKAPFMNNLHISCFKEKGAVFEKNSNGTLKDIQIYVALSNDIAPTQWVNGNLPFKGYGSIDSENFAGLDLFKSTDTERYITFGQRPSVSEGNLFVRIGVKGNINLKNVVNSIKESIDEWS